MESTQYNEFNYEKELEKFCRNRGIWDSKKKTPTIFVINKLDTIDVKHPDGYTYKQNITVGFTTKKIQWKYCHYCSEELSGNRSKKYCTDKCRDNARRIREKFEQLKPLGAQMIWVFKNRFGEPRWKECKVGYKTKSGKYIDKPLTNKNGKPKPLKEIS